MNKASNKCRTSLTALTFIMGVTGGKEKEQGAEKIVNKMIPKMLQI